MENQRDDLEKVLAALGRAQPPEGLEARVAARMEREIFAGPSMAAVWWRGAIGGAAVTMLALGLVMVVGHRMRGSVGLPDRKEIAGRDGIATYSGAGDSASAQSRRGPCASSGVLQVRRDSAAPSGEMVRIASVARSYSIADAPLTAQERELVRLARAGDPKELAILNPEIREKLEAQDTAQFQSFFAEPVDKPAPAGSSTAEAATVAAEPTAAEPTAAESTSAEPTARAAPEPTAAAPALEPAAGESK